MKKKVLVTLLAAAMVLGTAGCGGSEKEPACRGFRCRGFGGADYRRTDWNYRRFPGYRRCK